MENNLKPKKHNQIASKLIFTLLFNLSANGAYHVYLNLHELWIQDIKSFQQFNFKDLSKAQLQAIDTEVITLLDSKK